MARIMRAKGVLAGRIHACLTIQDEVPLLPRATRDVQHAADIVKLACEEEAGGGRCVCCPRELQLPTLPQPTLAPCVSPTTTTSASGSVMVTSRTVGSALSTARAQRRREWSSWAGKPCLQDSTPA